MTANNQSAISNLDIKPVSNKLRDSLLPSYFEWKTMSEMADILVKSGFLPSGIKTVEAALAIMIKGWELGIPPMQAISQVRLVNGEPTFNQLPDEGKVGEEV